MFLGFWLMLLLAGRSRLFQDPGTFWHILTGERIFQRGFPRADWLSFTYGGKPWIAHQWLAETVMAALHRLGGLDALLVSASAALAFLFAWLFHRVASTGIQTPRALFVVALAFLASSHHFHIRPHLVSLLLFAWMYARLADFEAGRIRMRDLVWLWPLFALWVNTHGAVVGGLATFALVVAGWVGAWAVGRESPIQDLRSCAGLIALSVACAATVLVNPYGLEMPRAWNSILQSRELPRMIIEHASLFRTRSWQVLVLAALYAAVLVAGHPRWRVTSIVPVVWLALTFDRVRHAPFFAVAATLAIADLLPNLRWPPRVKILGPLESTGAVARAPFPRAPVIAAAAVLATAALMHHAVPEHAPRLARLDPGYWPVDLLPELRSAERELPDGSPVLNDMFFGGFLAYHVPQLRVFVDDRWELYGDAFMVALERTDKGWLDGWVSRHHVTLAVAQHGSGLERYLETTGWSRIATSRAGALYRRAPLGSPEGRMRPREYERHDGPTAATQSR